VIYLDEVMFTLRSVNTREFSNKYQNIAVDISSINIKTTAVIAAITYEHGVLLHGCFDRSVNIDKFKFFIDELRNKLGNRRAVIFMDNLSVHRAKKTLEHMRDRGFEALFNAAYSPEYMPIEFVFSVVKRRFKQQKTNAIVNEKSVKTISLIKQSFESVGLQTVQHSIEHCLKKFDQINQD
jgi:transposase